MAQPKGFGYLTFHTREVIVSQFAAVGLGNAIMDALVRISDSSMLDRLGVTKGQMTPVDHERWMEVHDAVASAGVETASGGSCANTILSMGLMGADVSYAGRVGSDDIGRIYRESLSAGCNHEAVQVSTTHATGKCLSLITDDADRTMLTDLGASVTMSDLAPFDEHIREAEILHVTGYLLLGEPMASRCMEAIAIANQSEIHVSIDLADPFVVNATKDTLLHILEEFATVVFLNADEARALLGCGPKEAAVQLSEDIEHVVVKDGAKGSYVHHNGRLYTLGIHETDAVDSTGAGDAYAAGYLYGITQGWSAARCGDLGARIASLTVGQVGAVCRDVGALRAAVEAARG